MEARDAIRELLKGLLLSKGESAEFGDADSLLLSGRLQSIDAIEIALFIEREYSIDFSAIGFDQTQIDSVDEIVALIERERAK